MRKVVDENLSQIVDTRMEMHFSGAVPENDCKLRLQYLSQLNSNAQESKIANHFHFNFTEEHILLLNGLNASLFLVISVALADAKQPPLKESEICNGHMKNAKNISFFALNKPKSPEHLSKEEYLKCKQKIPSCIGSHNSSADIEIN